MKLSWLYNAYLTLGAWADNVFGLLTQSLGDVIEDWLWLFNTGRFIAGASPIMIPEWCYELSVWELMFGAGFGIFLVYLLIAFLFNILP